MQIYQLSNETIDFLSDKLSEMYRKHGCTPKETMRARLMLEESLIKYQSRFGEKTELYFRIYKVLSQTRMVVRIRTEEFDPFTLEENPMAFMIESVMASFEGDLPTWNFRNRENEILFTLRKKAKVNQLVKIAVAVPASALLGFLCRLLLPAKGISSFVENYISPLSNAYAGLFCVMAVLLTFFAISMSIVHIGDLAVVGSVGRKTMRRFYVTSTIMVLLATLPFLPFVEWSGGTSISLATKSIYDILIGFVPDNIVSPFLNFNSVHIMIIGAMFGFALLTMGQRGETVVKLFEECNLVSIYVNNFLNKFISFYVAFKVFELIVTSDFSTLSKAGTMVAAIIGGEAAFFIFYTIYTCVRTKIPFSAYFKALTPPLLVCLSSANFGAAFSASVDSMLALDAFDDRSNLAFNVGSVVFRPACTLVFVFSSFFMASTYGVEISVVWVVLAIVLSILLTAAVPNIPGVSVSVITLLFAQLGLPSEAVGLMIAVNAPLQFLTVAVDTWVLTGECIYLSKSGKRAAEES